MDIIYRRLTDQCPVRKDFFYVFSIFLASRDMNTDLLESKKKSSKTFILVGFL